MTRARVKKGYHHGDLRRALVDATVSLLKESDAEAITLRSVARTVGVDHTAAYRHFEDKTALLAAVAEEGFRQLTSDMKSCVARLKPDARASVRLRALASAYVGFALEHPSHYRVMMGPRLNVDERFPSLEGVVVDAFQLLLGEVKRGLSSGDLCDAKAEDLTVSIWTAAHGFATLALLNRVRTRSPAAASKYFDRVIDPLIRGISTK